MGGISSSVGIFSGINSAQLIEQLLSLEARPKQLAQQRQLQISQQRAAFLDINSSLLALKTAAQKFGSASVFKSSTATSSNEDAIGATAGTNAATGVYQFSVKRLVTTQQLLSRGFADSSTAAAGATSFTFEVGGGALSTDTKLGELNGGLGVERGKIQIKDATGATATVDLSTAATVGDVIDAINSTGGVSVKAKTSGDRIVITDTSGATGTLSITNGFGYSTATSLGIAKTSTSGVGQAVTGDRVRTLSGASALSSLNDGNGVLIRDGGTDLVITDREGTAHNITFGEVKTTTTDPQTNQPVTTVTQTRAATIQDVISYINAQTGGKVTAALNSEKTGIILTDTTGASTSNLIVRSGLDGRTTASDLGIETSAAGVASASVSGERLIASLNSVLAGSLRGGAGLSATPITVTDRAGHTTTLNLSAGALAGSLSDVVEEVNGALATAGVLVAVKVNRAGNGLALEDTSGGTGSLVVSGAAATELGIATAGATSNDLNGTNLQLKWLSRSTTLASLNGGKGIGTGALRITDASGNSRVVQVTSSQKTVDDLIKQISGSQGLKVELQVNANGDGLTLVDTSGGTGTLKVEDSSGTVAKALNLVGSDDNDGGVTEINGSFERTVTFAATDSLEKVASKINAAAVGVTAAIIRDGTGSSPYRLTLTSQRSGSIGRAIVDTGSFDLGLSSLSRGDDAIAFFGATDPAKGVLLSSSSNTLDNVIQGVTIDLKGTTTSSVELVVSRNTQAMEEAVALFVDTYNKALEKLDKYDVYTADTNTRGALFGDGTVQSIRDAMLRTVQSQARGVDGDLQRLFEVGVKIGSGSKLEFDREKFRAALERDPQNVEDLFAAKKLEPKVTEEEVSPGIKVRIPSPPDTYSQLGVAEQIGVLAAGFTSSVDGLISRKNKALDTQIDLQQSRVVSLDQKLEAKRLRLQRQFAAMEQAIASLQGQGNALNSIRSI